VQPKTTAGNHEGAWHPAGFKAKKAATGVNSILNLRSIWHSILSTGLASFGVQQTRTIQLPPTWQQACADATEPFHSSKRAALGLPTVNSITTLLFCDKGRIAEGTRNPTPTLRRAKWTTEEHE